MFFASRLPRIGCEFCIEIWVQCSDQRLVVLMPLSPDGGEVLGSGFLIVAVILLGNFGDIGDT